MCFSMLMCFMLCFVFVFILIDLMCFFECMLLLLMCRRRVLARSRASRISRNFSVCF